MRLSSYLSRKGLAGGGFKKRFSQEMPYEGAAPVAIIAGSNHFEVAIAVAITLFGVSSGAALATVVGVLTEVPFMLLLVELCKVTRGTFPRASKLLK